MSEETIRMVRGEQAKAAMDQFVNPALDAIRSELLNALVEAAASPMTEAKRAEIQLLSLGVKMVERVHLKISGAIIDGVVAQADAKYRSTIDSLSPEKRKWALF